MINVDDWLIDIENEQITQNNQLTTIENEQITQNNTLINHNNWITTLELHEYPESLRNLADVDDTNIGDGWLISYDIISDMFVMIDPPNTFPEAPNTNTAYIWKTVAGDG